MFLGVQLIWTCNTLTFWLQNCSEEKNTHIYIFNFLKLVLQVFGQLVRALYGFPLTGQAVKSVHAPRRSSSQ